MKLTIGTQRLQALLNKAVKGAGSNKNIPMTSLIAIELKDGELRLTTTDATNYLTLVADNVVGDDLYVAVQVDLLAKLVSRMTCAEVTLSVTDNSLEVSGNGKYQIDIPLEDDGTPVKLPNPVEAFNKGNKIGSVDSSVILTALTSLKPALATTLDYSLSCPWFTCYYVKDSITATDTFTVADCKQGFLEEPKLISPVVMDLLGLLSGEISVYADGDKMLFEADGGIVYGTIPSGIEHYSIDVISDLVNQGFMYSCRVVKSALLSLLDRISLFVGVYDNGKITLSFDDDGLTVTSRYASETIAYTDDISVGKFVCQTDVNTLTTQVKAQTGSEIMIEYGEDNAIKLVDGDVTSVVALLEE